MKWIGGERPELIRTTTLILYEVSDEDDVFRYKILTPDSVALSKGSPPEPLPESFHLFARVERLGTAKSASDYEESLIRQKVPVVYAEFCRE